jgi:hypothetical protein
MYLMTTLSDSEQNSKRLGLDLRQDVEQQAARFQKDWRL